MSAVRTYVTLLLPTGDGDIALRRRAPMHLSFDPVSGIRFELAEGPEVLITQVKYISDECYIVALLQLPASCPGLIDYARGLIMTMLGCTENVASDEDWGWRITNLDVDAMSADLRMQVADLAGPATDQMLEAECLRDYANAFSAADDACLDAEDELDAFGFEDGLDAIGSEDESFAFAASSRVVALNPALRAHTGYPARAILTKAEANIWRAAYPNDFAVVSNRKHLLAISEAACDAADRQVSAARHAERVADQNTTAARETLDTAEEQYGRIEGGEPETPDGEPTNYLVYLRDMANDALAGQPIVLPPLGGVLEEFELEYPDSAEVLVEYAIRGDDPDVDLDLRAAMQAVDIFVGARMGQLDTKPESPTASIGEVLRYARVLTTVFRTSITTPTHELVFPTDAPMMLAAITAMFPKHGNTLTTAYRCNYTPQQLVPAVQSLETWLDRVEASLEETPGLDEVTVSHNPDDGITTIQGPVGAIMPEMAVSENRIVRAGNMTVAGEELVSKLATGEPVVMDLAAMQAGKGPLLNRDEVAQLAGVSGPSGGEFGLGSGFAEPTEHEVLADAVAAEPEYEHEYEQEPDIDDEPDHDEAAIEARIEYEEEVDRGEHGEEEKVRLAKHRARAKAACLKQLGQQRVLGDAFTGMRVSNFHGFTESQIEEAAEAYRGAPVDGDVSLAE